MTHEQGLMSVSQRAYIHLHNSTHIWGTVPDGIQTHMRAYIHVFAHIHPRTHTYHGYRTRAHTHSTHLSTARCLLVDTDIHAHIHTYTHTRTRVRTHTHTHTHTHNRLDHDHDGLRFFLRLFLFSSCFFAGFPHFLVGLSWPADQRTFIGLCTPHPVLAKGHPVQRIAISHAI